MKNITEKEKKILILFMLCAFIVVSYMFVHVPLKEKNADLHKQVAETQQKLAEYESKQAALTNFNDKEKQIYKMKELWLEEALPKDILEEDIILRLKEIRTKVPAGCYPVSMEAVKFNAKGSDSELTTNPAQGLSMKNLDVSFTTKYSTLKEMLKNIINCRPKMNISDMSVSFGDKPGVADPLLKIDMKMNVLTYASNGLRLNKEEDLKKYTPFGTDVPKGNIFTPFAGMSPFAVLNSSVIDKAMGKGVGVIQTQNDFYVRLSPIIFDTPPLVFGKSGAASKAIAESKNDIMNVNFTFEKKGNKYYYKYSLNNVKYPEKSDSEIFTPVFQGVIAIRAIGNQIIGKSDKVGVKLNITNKTDIPVKVVIEGDDPVNRNIIVNGIEGIVREDLR